MMKNNPLQTFAILLCLKIFNVARSFHCSNYIQRTRRLQVSEDSWTIADDWSSLSSDNVENSGFDSSKLFNQDQSVYAAQAMEIENDVPLSKEEIWLADQIDEIHNAFSTLDEIALYDTKFEEDDFVSKQTMDDTMDQEVAMLVRCNEHPEELLVSEGRALAELTEREKNDPFQLVVFSKEKGFQPSKFMKTSVSIMFHRHSSPDSKDGIPSLKREGIAKWMTKSLKTENEGLVSAHDKRVLQTLSDFGTYGSGRLVLKDFEKLYLTAIVGKTAKISSGVSPTRHLELRRPFIDAVWRDIRNHGILSPVEAERKALVKEIEAKNELENIARANVFDENTVMDECEILDWDFSAKTPFHDHQDKRQASKSKSSHRTIDLASDKKTPLFVKDGKFVFIDESSCIGCMQCVNVAPASFMMLDSGRARTFHQRSSPDVEQAVASCPVSCMHGVTYRELQEFESARDEGDGKNDHRYLGQAHTPVHVAGMDSDKNRQSSWYHTLKHRCLVSSECPQKGCYDCPKFSNPGDNPYFKKNYKEAEHARAVHFTENGDADLFRKTADL